MKNLIIGARQFVLNLGPVEQAQVVASTAVVVMLITITSAMLLTGSPPRLMDFISILTVGTIGFVSVYFSLQHSRQLDEQRRQMMALYALAGEISRSVELDVVLERALSAITEQLTTRFGWIYLQEDGSLVLKRSIGTTLDFLEVSRGSNQPLSLWLNQPRVQRERLQEEPMHVSPQLKTLSVQFWASLPLRIKDAVAGILIVASDRYDMFTPKQAELLEAFGTQISVALNNAQLFERLKKSERQYVDLFENAPDIYLSINRHHTIVSCNRTGATCLDYPKGEIIGREFESLFVDQRRDAMRQQVEGMFTKGQGLRDVEEQMLPRGGRPFFVNLNSSLVFDERGSTVNARIVARDISERKKMEGAILHAQKIDSIGNLAGGIAHDFNNILSAILGAASIMRRRLTDRSKLSKYVEIIESSARRGSSLTRQLLTFARKTETLQKPVNINELIRETLHLFERSVTKEIIVDTHLVDDTAVVNGDDGQIQQALLNLFLNARDAMPNGGTLSVSTSVMIADARATSQFTSVKPGPFVAVRVSDTGHGIAREIQNRIFEPFFTTKDHGTGLGLSVVYGVIQSHGGFINLESSPGHGTTVTAYLPRSTVAAESAVRRRRHLVAVPPHRGGLCLPERLSRHQHGHLERDGPEGEILGYLDAHSTGGLLRRRLAHV